MGQLIDHGLTTHVEIPDGTRSRQVSNRLLSTTKRHLGTSTYITDTYPEQVKKPDKKTQNVNTYFKKVSLRMI